MCRYGADLLGEIIMDSERGEPHDHQNLMDAIRELIPLVKSFEKLVQILMNSFNLSRAEAVALLRAALEHAAPEEMPEGMPEDDAPKDDAPEDDSNDFTP